MEHKRLQNSIAESRLALPILSIITIAVWISLCFINPKTIPATICLLFTSYLMVELNNSNVLMRVYSRMVSCSFMFLTTIFLYQLTQIGSAILILCIVGFLTCIFRTYQDSETQGWTFYAFICIGISSIVWVQILYFVPILWILMKTNLLSLNIKSFISSIFGLILPNIIFFGYTLYITNDYTTYIRHINELIVFQDIFNFTNLSEKQLISTIWIIILAIISTIHYLIDKKNDNIKTRLLFGIFTIINWSAIIFLLLQPTLFSSLITIIISTSSPLIAHLITLTHSKLSNILFKLIVLISIFIIIYNFTNLQILKNAIETIGF